MSADGTLYPIYIPSRDRYQPERRYTIKALNQYDVPFRVVVVPSQADFYREVVGDDRVLVLPDDDHVLKDARNWIKDHATAEGHKRHWQLDDNIICFRRWFKGRRIPCDPRMALGTCETLSDRYENVAISGLDYTFNLSYTTKVPFRVNTHVYSCVSPDTPILCADLVWRPAGNLLAGDQIVGFDEHATLGERGSRKYRTATVERNAIVDKPCQRVSTDIGVPVVASDDHPWLVWRRPTLVRRGRDGRMAGESSMRQGELTWVCTSDLRVGDKIAHLARPWSRDESHDGGWVSGMFDGEGSMVVRAGESTGSAIGIAQKEGPVLQRVTNALMERGYRVTNSNAHSVNGANGVYVRGGFPEQMRFAGEFRPTRIMNRASVMFDGRKVWRNSTYELATVTSIESVGLHPVAEITTSTGTFITGGYLSHNCSLILNETPFRWRLVLNDDTDMCLQALAAGWCTLNLMVFTQDKKRTMNVKGGNTDAHYQEDGRLLMAETLRRQWPHVVTIAHRWGRPQHSINWRAFKTPLKRREDVDLESMPTVDEGDITLRQVREPNTIAMQRIFAEQKAKKEMDRDFDRLVTGDNQPEQDQLDLGGES